MCIRDRKTGMQAREIEWEASLRNVSPQRVVDDYVAQTPLGRLEEPEDVADVVVFLCSDLARFVTGQNIVVDGGMTLHGAGVDGLLDRFRPFLSPE